MKKKYELEYSVPSSPKVLFARLSTTSGLAEWFADNVDIKKDIYSFFWGGDASKARLISKHKEESIRFTWIEDEKSGEDTYFEFRLAKDDLTQEISLIITDFAEDEDMDDAVELWDKQIEELQMVLGV